MLGALVLRFSSEAIQIFQTADFLSWAISAAVLQADTVEFCNDFVLNQLCSYCIFIYNLELCAPAPLRETHTSACSSVIFTQSNRDCGKLMAIAV